MFKVTYKWSASCVFWHSVQMFDDFHLLLLICKLPFWTAGDLVGTSGWTLTPTVWPNSRRSAANQECLLVLNW
jgi:hypothetical protein